MPKLGKKDYAYTKKGKAQYKKDKKRLGKAFGGAAQNMMKAGGAGFVMDAIKGGGMDAYAHLDDMRSETSGLVNPNAVGSTEPEPTAYGGAAQQKSGAIEEPLQSFQEGGPAIDEQMGELMLEEEQLMPEEEQMALETELPDEEMEDNYIDFVISEALIPEEEQYLLERLGGDDQLSIIFDKVIQTASEFAGSGLVEGPGSAVSDSIPARLSDGEFVMTSKAANQIGPENLQGMMDEAELTSDIAEEERRVMQSGGYVEEEEEEQDDEALEASAQPIVKEVIPDSLVERELKKAMLAQSPRFSLFTR